MDLCGPMSGTDVIARARSRKVRRLMAGAFGHSRSRLIHLANLRLRPGGLLYDASRRVSLRRVHLDSERAWMGARSECWEVGFEGEGEGEDEG